MTTKTQTMQFPAALEIFERARRFAKRVADYENRSLDEPSYQRTGVNKKTGTIELRNQRGHLLARFKYDPATDKLTKLRYT